jgi:hypothetical protein
MRKALSSLALAVVLVACGPHGPDPEPEEPTRCDTESAAPAAVPAFELLREAPGGDRVPLVSGDVLPRHYGSQGGSHFYVYPRAFSADATAWYVDVTLRSPSGGVLASGGRGFTPCAGQWIRPLELTVFIETYDDVAGKLTVTAQPGQGAPFTVEADVSVGGS